MHLYITNIDSLLLFCSWWNIYFFYILYAHITLYIQNYSDVIDSYFLSSLNFHTLLLFKVISLVFHQCRPAQNTFSKLLLLYNISIFTGYEVLSQQHGLVINLPSEMITFHKIPLHMPRQPLRLLLFHSEISIFPFLFALSCC